MKDLVQTIVQAIVNNPDSVVIEEKESVDFPGLQIIYISVAPEDTGVVIGKRGRTINAIRDIVSISAIRSKKRVRVVLKESEDKQQETVEEPAEENFNIKDGEEEDILNDEV